jgi:hypothetical protein
MHINKISGCMQATVVMYGPGWGSFALTEHLCMQQGMIMLHCILQVDAADGCHPPMLVERTTI